MMNLKGTGNDFSRFFCGNYGQKPYTDFKSFSMIVNFEEALYALMHLNIEFSELKQEELANVFSLHIDLETKTFQIFPAGTGCDICFIDDFKKVIEGTAQTKEEYAELRLNKFN